MHAKSTSHRDQQRTPSLLDPCYHLDKSSSSPAHSHGHSHSPCPSTLSRTRDTTWVDETGEHDPDFHPFAVPSALASPAHSHHDSPRRRSLDLPSKGSRPLTLEPGLYAALRAHERVLAQQQAAAEHEASHKRCESRRPSFLGLPRCRSRTSVNKEQHSYTSNELVFSDDSDDDSIVYSPPPLPELESDLGSDEHDDDDDREDKHGHDHDLKHQLAGLHLRVDLALFRAKKRLRRRVGLD